MACDFEALLLAPDWLIGRAATPSSTALIGCVAATAFIENFVVFCGTEKIILHFL